MPKINELCGGKLLSTHSQEFILFILIKEGREGNGLDCNLKKERMGALRAKCEYKHANLPPLCTQATIHGSKRTVSSLSFRTLLKGVGEIRQINCFNR